MATGTARNGDVELHYETFGSPADPTLLLVNGLGSQCINFADAWCERFVAAGYHVVRFDNRDVGPLVEARRRPLHRRPTWPATRWPCSTPSAWPQAHVMGLSMGGMIVQRLAIDHPDRLLTLTSVMSAHRRARVRPELARGAGLPDGPPATSRQYAIDNHVAAIAVYGSKPDWIDEDEHASPGGRGLRPLLLPGRRRPPDEGRRGRPAPGRRPAGGRPCRRS